MAPRTFRPQLDRGLAACASALVCALSFAGPAEPPIARDVAATDLGVEAIEVEGAPLPSGLTPPGCERLLVRRVEPGADGWTTLHLGGERPEDGSATLVRDPEGALSGFLLGADGRRWRILARPDGGARLEFVDAARLPPCADIPVPVEIASPFMLPASAMACDDGKPIDVLVLYTAAARAAAGGVAGIEGQIVAAVAAANTAYANSRINARLNLVLQVETDYVSSDFGTDLGRLASPDEGFLDWAHTLRDTVSADMVALIRADGEYCGIAYLMYSNGPESQGIPFSVTGLGCLSNQTFAHELGHNMGCCHAVGDGGGCGGGGIWPWSVGWRFNGVSGTQWRTVMAYAPGSRLDHFSNPAVSFDGRATGVAIGQSNQADNAATINATSPTIANFRCSRGSAVQADCDANGSKDVLDVAFGLGSDRDLDGRLDQCTLSSTTPCGTPAAAGLAAGALVSSARNPSPVVSDCFGSSVAGNETIVAVAVQGDDDRGNFAGRVDLFRRAADRWIADGTVYSPAPAAGAVFGSSVAVDRDLVVVGEYAASVGGVVTGRAHVFARGASGWSCTQSIECPMPTVGDLFGDRMVARDGTLIVGARGHRAGGLAGAGAAFVFRRNGDRFDFVQRILAATPQSQALFGFSLATDGTRIVVGTPYESSGSSQTGAVHLYRLVDGAWALEARLQGPSTPSRFGGSVAIDGDRLAIGAYSDAISGYEAGAVHTFRLAGASWNAGAVLRPAAGATRVRIGNALAMSGMRMLVGNRPDSSATGSCDLWLDEGGTWVRTSSTLSGTVPFLRRDIGVVGAPFSDEGLVDAGAARLAMWASDCDGNGVPDRCDIDAGADSDINGDGVPDGCGGVIYDLDQSGAVDNGDVAILLLDLGLCASPCPADLNADGSVDLGDLAILLLQFG
jgi:hypothetical protein